MNTPDQLPDLIQHVNVLNQRLREAREYLIEVLDYPHDEALVRARMQLFMEVNRRRLTLLHDAKALDIITEDQYLNLINGWMKPHDV